MSNTVILCPIYAAGEKNDKKFKQENFSKLIEKNSNVQVINIQNKDNLKSFLKKNLYKDEIIICMGAGSISNWIREIGKELK